MANIKDRGRRVEDAVWAGRGDLRNRIRDTPHACSNAVHVQVQTAVVRVARVGRVWDILYAIGLHYA